MRIFKTRLFNKWTKKIKLSDELLIKSIDEMKSGLYEAYLGSNLYKKRISISGRGKRAGARTLVVFKKDTKAFFVYGFAKNKKTNIKITEEKAYKMLSKYYVELDDKQIELMLAIEKLIEVV